MTLSLRALAVALIVALVSLAAQGPAAAAAKRKKAAPAARAPTAEKRVVAPVRSGKPATTRRGAAAMKKTDKAADAPMDLAPDRPSAKASDRVSDETSGSQTDSVAATTTKPTKTKVYSFGAMDVEGKLKTPQLLYFLNRVKLELEMSAPDHRSFMKELERTADDPNL